MTKGRAQQERAKSGNLLSSNDVSGVYDKFLAHSPNEPLSVLRFREIRKQLQDDVQKLSTKILRLESQEERALCDFLGVKKRTQQL